MKQLKSMKRFMAFVLAVALVTGSLTVPVQAKTKKAVKSVSITNVKYGKVVLKKGKTFALKTKVEVTGKASKKVTFASSNKKVATVSSKGKIKAVKNGTAKITVKSTFNKKKKATVKVVVGTPVTKITLDKTSATMKTGETLTLTASLSPAKPSEKNVAFISSDEKVATVSAKGVVTAIAPGTVTITAEAKDASKKKATCQITVTKAEDKKEEVKPAPSAAPSEAPTSAPSEQPSKEPEAPSDYYDPSVVYDYDLTDTDAKEADWEVPSVQVESVSGNDYKMVWSDNFDGDALNLDDWNVEEHKPGWVNSEQQAYVNSEKNIFVKDGNLVLRPIREKGENGADYITSGRVNTQGKHDFKYGLFEARVKVPTGQGYLPAFWMMPTDENLYGQWPKCGEIDIMEVMGQETDKLYGTIHYGQPHGSRQGTAKAEKGHDYAEEYHTYACEWMPGKIVWYVDGVKYHEATNWYTKEAGETPVTYPAPFDQPFYMILNLAVGGSWVGMIDETTQINPAAFVVDYVKVFQRDAYDENVTMPSEADLREPDENGNYMNNSDFSEAEDLDDETGWVFMTQQGGEATAAIADGQMKIAIEKDGSKDYSVQLVQAGLPLVKGATYRVQFDAKADAERNMNCAVKAPNFDYYEHMSESVALTTEFATYTYDFVMTEDTDPACRLEFNMGAAGSTADIALKNVTVVKTKEAQSEDEIEKVVLKDGNSVYNGSFQEGADRMAYWTRYVDESVSSDVTMNVTDLSDGRRLYVNVTPALGVDAMEKVQLRQTNVKVDETVAQVISFEAESKERCCIEAVALGKTHFINLCDEKMKYTMVIEPEEMTNRDVVFNLGDARGVKIDNVRLEQNLLIKNGSFTAGTSGFDIYRDNASDATYVVDSQKKDKALALTINNTNDAEWKIQVKQGNVKLEKDQWYQLDFDIQSSIDRSIQYSIQRDGSIHTNAEGKEDWTPYVQAVEKLTAATDYTHVKKVFKMQEPTDAGSIFNIALGAVGGVQIDQQHEIFIDNITLIPVDEPELEEKPEGSNLLANGDFSQGKEGWFSQIQAPQADGTWDFSEGKAKVTINTLGAAKPGDESWHVNLKQTDLTLVKGCVYEVKATLTSDVDRTAQFSSMNAGSTKWYVQGDNMITLKAGEAKEVTFTISVGENDTDTSAYIGFNLGKVSATTPDASVITIDDVSMVKISGDDTLDPKDPEDSKNPEDKKDPEESTVSGNNLLKGTSFAEGAALGSMWVETIADWAGGPGADASHTLGDGTLIYDIKNVGTEDWNVQLKQSGVKLEAGKTYIMSYDVISTTARTIKSGLQSASYAWYGGSDPALEADVSKHVEAEFTMKTTDENVSFYISMGQIIVDDQMIDTPAGVITISNISLVEKVTE